MELNESDKKLLLNIARSSIEKALNVKDADMPENIPDKFNEKRGAFVTLHKNGNLRGCVGYILPYETLYNTVVQMAKAAALNDRRFEPVTKGELDHIKIEISVLTQPKKIETLDEFIIGKHGIIINLHGSQAVFLPQVAVEQNWDKETTLKHLCAKAGLSPDAYKNDEMQFNVFEAILFEE